jgi:hypothetical protein
MHNGTGHSKIADNFDKLFPADFIAEGVDQTRGWFFTLTCNIDYDLGFGIIQKYYFERFGAR